jgi:5-methylcytosine-specific restriction endonuclease McrA
MSRFTQLRDGKIVWSSTIREWLREHEKPDECIYCGTKVSLTTEHILPRSCKLLYNIHDKRGTLNVDRKGLGCVLCPAYYPLNIFNG